MSAKTLTLTTTEIHPFPGLHYDPRRVDLSAVVTQPYDRINASMKAAYQARSPHNIVHVTLGGRGEYSDAARRYADWLETGVLVQDRAPAFYVYEQRFRAGGPSWRTRRGFYAVAGLRPYSSGAVLPHEVTFLPPRLDRLRYLRKTGLHTGPIFFMYRDPERRLEPFLDEASRGEPLLEATDDAGERHRVWKMAPGESLAAALEELGTLFIADGHHRYEAALAYRDERAGLGLVTGGTLGAGGRLGVLFNMAATDLLIWPTHRLVRAETPVDAARLAADLEREWALARLEGELPAALERLERASDSAPAFILVSREGGGIALRLATVRDLAASAAAIPGPGSARWKGIHTNLLQHRVLTPLLGISPEEIEREERLDYQRGAAEAVEAVRRGTHSAAFLLAGTPVETVREIASGGERMPQKSTDFYPKLLTGLVMHRIGPAMSAASASQEQETA